VCVCVCVCVWCVWCVCVWCVWCVWLRQVCYSGLGGGRVVTLELPRRCFLPVLLSVLLLVLRFCVCSACFSCVLLVRLHSHTTTHICTNLCLRRCTCIGMCVCTCFFWNTSIPVCLTCVCVRRVRVPLRAFPWCVSVARVLFLLSVWCAGVRLNLLVRANACFCACTSIYACARLRVFLHVCLSKS
jgi:hypothetical protein